MKKTLALAYLLSVVGFVLFKITELNGWGHLLVILGMFAFAVSIAVAVIVLINEDVNGHA